MHFKVWSSHLGGRSTLFEARTIIMGNARLFFKFGPDTKLCRLSDEAHEFIIQMSTKNKKKREKTLRPVDGSFVDTQ